MPTCRKPPTTQLRMHWWPTQKAVTLLQHFAGLACKEPFIRLASQGAKLSEMLKKDNFHRSPTQVVDKLRNLLRDFKVQHRKQTAPGGSRNTLRKPELYAAMMLAFGDRIKNPKKAPDQKPMAQFVENNVIILDSSSEEESDELNPAQKPIPRKKCILLDSGAIKLVNDDKKRHDSAPKDVMDQSEDPAPKDLEPQDEAGIDDTADDNSEIAKELLCKKRKQLLELRAQKLELEIELKKLKLKDELLQLSQG